MVTIHARVAKGRERLRRAGITPEEADLDARLLAQKLLGWDAARFFTSATEPEPADFAALYEPLVARREGREPLAYITGRQEFWGLDFEISPATNTLPIRRLDPKMGETRDIRVAWVRFPELRVEPTRQRYTRVAERRYRFENLDSGYSVEILVDDAGLVLEYPDLWARSPNP